MNLQRFLNLLSSRNLVYLNKVYWRFTPKHIIIDREWVSSNKLYEIIKINCFYISLINITCYENDARINYSVFLDIYFSSDVHSNSLGYCLDCMSCKISVAEFEEFLRMTTDKVNWKKEGF